MHIQTVEKKLLARNKQLILLERLYGNKTVVHQDEHSKNKEENIR